MTSLGIGLAIAGSWIGPQDAGVAPAGWLADLDADHVVVTDHWCRMSGRDGGGLAPLVTAAVALTAPRAIFVTEMSATAYNVGHIARYGANLWALTSGRWALSLVGRVEPGEVALLGDPVGDVDRAERLVELIRAVRSHWAGGEEHSGMHIRSTGHIVRPRPGPTAQPPIVVDTGGDVSPQLASCAEWVTIRPGESAESNGTARRLVRLSVAPDASAHEIEVAIAQHRPDALTLEVTGGSRSDAVACFNRLAPLARDRVAQLQRTPS